MAQKIQPYNEFNIDWVDTDLLKKKHTIHVHCKIQKEQGQDVSALRGGGGGQSMVKLFKQPQGSLKIAITIL